MWVSPLREEQGGVKEVLLEPVPPLPHRSGLAQPAGPPAILHWSWYLAQEHRRPLSCSQQSG